MHIGQVGAGGHDRHRAAEEVVTRLSMRLTVWGIGRHGSDALGLDLVGMGCRSMGHQEALGRGSLLETQRVSWQTPGWAWETPHQSSKHVVVRMG